MTGTSDIVGYTLAEIALVLVFCVIAMDTHAVTGLKKQLRTAQDNLFAAQRQLSAQAKLVSKRIDQPTKLRSSAPPSCFETGFDRNWLFTTTITGRDSFEIGSNVLTFDQLMARYANQIAASKANGCVPRIQVAFSPGIQVIDYDQALKRLEGQFYPRRLGIRP